MTDHQQPARQALSRRSFLTGLSVTVLAVGQSACANNNDTLQPAAVLMEAGGPPSVPELSNPGKHIVADRDVRIRLDWPRTPKATGYDVELNGRIVASALAQPGLELAFGDRALAPQGGTNQWRVRATNGAGARWSLPDRFEVSSVGQIRARTFDFEDLGPIELTTESTGSAIIVSPAYAFGGTGQGAALICESERDTRAYKNHSQVVQSETWLRLCLRPESWSRDDISVSLARITTEQSKSELLYWRTGSGLHSTSVKASTGLPAHAWSQVQIGVRSDGTVELWQFDGTHEVLVGVGTNRTMADGADRISLGCVNPNLDLTFEIWLDELAVAKQKLPWASPATDRSKLDRPAPLDPSTLGDRFSFVFGSCNNASLLPYDTMAIGAAARTESDFVIHLGDHGYPDTGAYRQSERAYHALWADLGHESNVASLLRRPWLVLASDHDLGGNNIHAETVQPFASRAFDTYNQNDSTVEPQGRYGTLDLVDGEVELIWLEEVIHRSPIEARNDRSKSCLGPEQKEWFLDRIATSTADLMIVASQTTIGHVSESGWVQYAAERDEIVAASLARDGWTRWLSGDKHTARWAWFEDRLVEWGAAAWAEIPQGEPQAAAGVLRAASGPAGAFPTRDAAIEFLTLQGVADATSFGRAEIDRVAGTAHFTVRDNRGEVRVQNDGTILEEVIDYRTRPWRST